MLNFAKRQLGSDRYLSALGHFILILSYFQVEEGCRDNFASVFNVSVSVYYRKSFKVQMT